MVSINQEVKDIKKALKDYPDIAKINLKRPSVATTYVVGRNRTLIVFRDLANTPADHGTITHEFFHVIEYVFEALPIPHNEDTSEAWAYALAHLVKKFYEKLYEK